MATELTLTTATDLTLAQSREEAEKTASFMAKEYREATAEIRRHMEGIEAQGERLKAAFVAPEDYSPFEVGFYYSGNRYSGAERAGRIFDEMKRRAWRALIDHLGVKNVMSVAKRKEFEDQMEKGDLPEIDEEAILGILFGLAGQARDFAREAAKEVFGVLRPCKGAGGKYKTNDHFRVGRRVILTWKVERYDHGRFRVNHRCDQELTAIDGVFHLLDGKGVMREHRGPLVNGINGSPNGRGETEYFRFKCFKNHNLHLEMKRLDLVKLLNLQATGEAVLGADME